MNNDFRQKNNNKGYKKNGNFYIYTLLGAVVLCILVGVLAYKATTGPKKTNTTVTPEVTQSEEIVVSEFAKPSDLVTSTGLIEKIDGKILFLYDIKDNKRYQLDIDSTTIIVDKYDKPLILAELSVGNIIDFTFPTNSLTLTEVKKSPKAWEHPKVSIQFHDTIEKVITFDSKDYKYNDNTIVEYSRGSYPLENITPHDTITFSGHGDNIYYIKVLKGHGTIEFIENTKISDGSVELDTTDIIQIENLAPLIVSEGAHKVIVKGSNISPYTEDVYVEANGTTVIDLNKIVTKRGLLLLDVNVSDYKVTINDELRPDDEPILLDYGIHNLKVEAEGYVGYEGTLTIKQPETSMKVELTEKVLMKKIAISTNPSDADIYVDSAYVGKSPITQSIIYGQHTITAKLSGYIDLSIPIIVNEDTKPGVDFTFTKSENVIPTDDIKVEDVGVIENTESTEGTENTEGNSSSLFGD